MHCHELKLSVLLTLATSAQWSVYQIFSTSTNFISHFPITGKKSSQAPAGRNLEEVEVAQEPRGDGVAAPLGQPAGRADVDVAERLQEEARAVVQRPLREKQSTASLIKGNASKEGRDKAVLWGAAAAPARWEGTPRKPRGPAYWRHPPD